jgi:hypothetical protein
MTASVKSGCLLWLKPGHCIHRDSELSFWHKTLRRVAQNKVNMRYDDFNSNDSMFRSEKLDEARREKWRNQN